MRKKAILICSVVAVCALSAVATALAASSTTHHARSQRASTLHGRNATPPNNAGGPPAGGPGGPGDHGMMGVVHAEGVTLNKAGTEYINFTADNGTVKSVEASAGKLTIVEGSKSVTYKTVTLSIPGEATVTLDGKSSSLSGLAEGDHVCVTSTKEGTTVFAVDSSFHPEGGPGHGGPPAGGAPPQGGETAKSE